MVAQGSKESEKMTIYGYARVSSDEQRKTGLSTDIQKKELMRQGVPEDHIYIDAGKSAGVNDENITITLGEDDFIIKYDLKKRPEFKKLMHKLYADIDNNPELVFLKYDRTSRNIAFGELFFDWMRLNHIKPKCLTEPDDPFIRRMLFVLAHTELEKTATRNNDIHKGIYAEGGYPYKAPTGYIKNSKREDGTLKYPNVSEYGLIIDEEAAKQVKTMFEMMAAGEDYKEVCAKLKINSQTLYDTIHNATYTGRTHLKNEWKKTDNIPAIISDELYERANANIKHRTNNPQAL